VVDKADKQASEDQIKKFHLDVAILYKKYTYDAIGEKMGYKKSNFRNYRSGRNTITERFLEKFYKAWGKELNTTFKKHRADYTANPLPETESAEGPDNYNIKNEGNSYMDILRKLVDNNQTLVETNKKLVDAVLDQRGDKPDQPPS
jgi:transcriptional regulator with XRE-family HTH domain